MSETRCPECQCLLKDKDLKNDKCWKCGLSPLDLTTKSELKEQKKQEGLEKEKKRQKKFEKFGYSMGKKYGKRQDRTFSEKYAILHIFKSILWILLVLYIPGGLIAIKYFSDLPGDYGWEIVIFGIFWLFVLFGTYCGIKIIDFLFDLDKVKSDRV